MLTNSIRVRRRRMGLFVSASAAAAATLWASAAQAQTTPAPVDAASTDASASAPSEIVVTGTHVVRGGFDTPTPVTAVGSEQLGLESTSNIADLTRLVPSLTATSTPATSNANSITPGGNYFNVRDLGQVRTLSLVDGKRFVPTNTTGQVDANNIPSVLIDRVDVVTGGVSSVYGSDAVAGVVNLILKKNLQGFIGNVQYGETQYGDSKDYFASGAYGTSFADGRGHFEIASEYQKNTGISQAISRPWQKANWGVLSNPAYTPTNGQPAQLIVRNFQVADLTPGGLITSGALKGNQFGPGGVLQPFTYGADASASYMSGGSGINPGDYVSLQVPLKRWNVYGRLSYEISPSISAWIDGSYARSEGVSDYVPPFNFDTVISTNNAYLSSAVKNALAAAGQTSFTFGRIGYDMGYLSTDAITKTGRAIGGLKGNLGNGWTWDTSAEYGESHFVVIKHDILNSNYANAINAVINPATGQPSCASTLTNPTDGCVPINLFGAGSPSQAALNYVFGNEADVSITKETDVTANLQGTPFHTWAGPVSLAVGGEYRREAVDRNAGPLVSSGAFLTGGDQSLHGKFNVVEGYLETVVPLLRDVPFVKAIDFNGAVREAKYSSAGYATTWKAGLSYEVNDQLRFRATQSRDLRAPNLDELYSAGLIHFPTVINPATNQQLNITAISGGNSNLKPETADTFTGGAIFSPSWFKGFQASVDYYHTVIHNYITTLSAQDIVNGCFAGSTTLCSFITRDANGNPAQISLQNNNIARFVTSGVDIDLSYRRRMSDFGVNLPGAISLRALGTYVQHLTLANGISTIDRAGDVGTGNGGVPHWRGNLSVTYDDDAFTAYVAERIIGGGKYNNTYSAGFINKPNVSGQYMTDLTLQYRLKTNFGKLTLYGTVLNLFNAAPPIDPQNFFEPTETNPVLYDVIGRIFRVGVKVAL
jgi:iron complex outermembrane receptor protein